jgi:hypothetical protein
MGLGAAFKKATDTKGPHDRQCVDPFHLVAPANEAINKACRWAWNIERDKAWQAAALTGLLSVGSDGFTVCLLEDELRNPRQVGRTAGGRAWEWRSTWPPKGDSVATWRRTRPRGLAG